MAITASVHGETDRLIMRKAVQRLSERLPELADQLVQEILNGEGQDRPAELTDDLWEVCHVGLRSGIEAILNPDKGRADLAWAERLGRLRAEQGLPLDQLLRSYRLAGCVFWEGVVEVVSEEFPDQVPTLVRHATRTWHTIDEQSSIAAEAYRRTEYAMLRRSDERVQAMVDALLEGRGVDRGLLCSAATVLGLPAHGRYAVVVLRQDDPLNQRAYQRPAAARGIRFLWRMRADAQIALVVLGAADLDELQDVIRSHAGSHAGLSPVVESLADVGRARWLAELALRTCRGPEPEVARLDRRLPDALIVSQPELAEHLRREVLGAFETVEASYRDVLLTTLDMWLRCDGSAAKAAARLYCHHNTVLNRLRRIERITGRSLSRPRDLVELTLALGVHRLSDDAPPLPRR